MILPVGLSFGTYCGSFGRVESGTYCDSYCRFALGTVGRFESDI